MVAVTEGNVFKKRKFTGLHKIMMPGARRSRGAIMHGRRCASGLARAQR
jgi:hypothetical protein